MSTRALKNHAATRSVPKAEPKAVRTRTVQVPGKKTVARRLAALTAADMPWLRKDVHLTPPDGGPEVCGPPGGSQRNAPAMARRTVRFNKTGIGKLPDDKPVVYTIETNGGRNNYTGIAQRGRVQETLKEHLPQGPDPVPGAKVRVEQVDTIAAARERERAINARSHPKYNGGNRGRPNRGDQAI